MFEISGVSFERHFVIEKSGSKWDWHDEVIAVMEYSGFQGKNGRKTVGIYEGDIIRIQYEDGPAVGDVEFCDGFFGFNVREEALRHPKYFSPFHEQDRPEVIGNIYENPELIN